MPGRGAKSVDVAIAMAMPLRLYGFTVLNICPGALKPFGRRRVSDLNMEDVLNTSNQFVPLEYSVQNSKTCCFDGIFIEASPRVEKTGKSRKGYTVRRWAAFGERWASTGELRRRLLHP